VTITSAQKWRERDSNPHTGLSPRKVYSLIRPGLAGNSHSWEDGVVNEIARSPY